MVINMKDKISAKLLRHLMICFLVVFAGISFYLTLKNVSPKYVFSYVELQKEYTVGSVLEFPKRKVEVGGKSYDTETVLYYPDGTVTKCDRVVFSQSGVYTVEYRTVVSDQLYSNSTKFNVIEKAFGVIKNSKVEYKTDDSVYNTGISGIWVDLAKGDKFTYNKVIDLSVLDEKEEAISLLLLPKNEGLRDLTDISITFTDAYDSSNKVIVHINCFYTKGKQGESAWEEHVSMYFAGTSETSLFGYRYDEKTGGVYRHIDEVYNSIRPRFAYETYFSFSGGYNKNKSATYAGDGWVNKVGQEFLTVAFDLDKGWVLGPDNGHAAARASMEEPLLVADLTDEMVYSSAWKGFTTGEVYVSIEGDGYISSSAEIMINKIGREDLSAEYCFCSTNPTVNVDIKDYAEDALPDAKVGEAYPLFKAIGTDCFNGSYSVSPRVFFQYGYENCWEMNVENNAFIPDREGEYTLVYTVIDGYCQVDEKIFKVNAKNEIPEIVIDKSNVIGECKTGETVSVSSVVASGGSGCAEISINVKLGSEIIPVSDGTIKPIKSGEYTIEITATDWIGQAKSENYTLQVLENDELVADYNPISLLPKYFIEGKMYVLPNCEFIDYGEEIKTVAPKIQITDCDGVHNLGNDRKYTVKKCTDNKVTVQYYAVSDSKETYLEPIVIPVIDLADGGNLGLKKYFKTSESVTVDMRDDSVSFECVVDGALEFIKSLIADKFSIKFKIAETENAFGTFEVCLTDSINPNEQIKLAFKKLPSDNILVHLNGKRVVGTISTTFTNSLFTLIQYSDGVLTLNRTEMRIPLRNYFNGEKFSGFSSGKVYFSAEIKDVTDVSKVFLTSINNQMLSNYAVDADPELAFIKDISMTNAIGSIVEISDIYADDVLDTFISKVITVKDPRGNIVTATDGTLLESAPCRYYSIAFDLYGMYTIDYVINNKTYTFKLGVYDQIKPIINVEGEVRKTAKVGENISLPNATVTDNQSTNCKVYIFVVSPLYIQKVYQEGMTYDNAGTYAIKYVAYDDVGNMAYISYTIQVK